MNDCFFFQLLVCLLFVAVVIALMLIPVAMKIVDSLYSISHDKEHTDHDQK